MDPGARIIVNLTRGNVVCEHSVIADRPRRRMRGLLGRDSLPGDEGMLLHPAPSIHTAFMRFPIDLAFLDGTLGVVKIVERLRPWRLAVAPRARAVLELAAGEARRRGIQVGDQLGVIDVADSLKVVERLAALNGTNHGGPQTVSRGAHLGFTEASPARESVPAVAVPDSTRVLVVGPDRRFRSVAAALLTRRGCSVALGERTTNAAELARREGPEVVVLDAGDSLPEAARDAAQIETLEPRVGVVVVGTEPQAGLSTMPVIAKWGSFDELYDAIQRARPTSARRRLSGTR